MENQLKTRKNGFPLSLIWIASTIIFCAVFILVSIPRVQAQSRQQDDPSGQYISIIRSVFDFIQRHYVEEVDPKLLFEGAMSGMLNSLGDPHSTYLTELDMPDLNDITQGSFGGVGLYISKQIRSDGKPAYIEVSAPIEDTPGWRSGINPGDLIIEINGESTEPLSSDEAATKLRGVPGESVRLLIRRGEKLEFPVTIVRAVIEVPTVKSAMIGDIGYLKLLTFTNMTADRARDALNDFQSKNYKSVILDLRNNYGGLLNSAVSVTNLFVEGGIVVTTKSRVPSDNYVYYARSKAVTGPDVPVVVLINRGSASASEIVAGALKDRGRAYLVGEKSFGKGSVQQVYPLSSPGSGPGNVGFKLTTARYYTPSDVNIDKIGIPPDREILFPEFTVEEAVKLNELINENLISDFVAANPGASNTQVDNFAGELSRKYDLDFSLLRRLIRNEQNRTVIAPVYDLEYDFQLQEAVKILNTENFQSLMRTSKTLKALQEEALQDPGFALAS